MINTRVSSGTTSHIATAAFSLVYWNAQFCLPLSGEYGEPNTRSITFFSGMPIIVCECCKYTKLPTCRCFSHLAETTLVGEISGVNQHI